MDRNEDGTLRNVLWAVEYIDEERAEREQLRSEAEKSAAASQAKSAFLANMSHEIRTPINAVLGMDEMILRECEDKTLFGDSVRIKQCILNLLTNAVKYTHEGSVKLAISSEKSEAPNSILLKVTVTDTGIGIKEEDMQKLFSPFERIEEGRNKTIEGTGLGMSIVMKMLEMMGSRLEVKACTAKARNSRSLLSRKSWTGRKWATSTKPMKRAWSRLLLTKKNSARPKHTCSNPPSKNTMTQ